jgi:4-amino-4-deoxy-L-arabinose transferase-like glycosyltransferase
VRRPGAELGVAALLGLGGVAMRVRGALAYPADWGFDATYNWAYIYRVTKTWALPAPADAWAAADPPLYFYLCGGLLRAARVLADRTYPLVLVPLLSVAAGLAVVALAWLLVRRLDPGNPRRALLAAGLLLYLPAHVHMSVMVNEEIVATLLSSAAVFLLATRSPAAPAPGRAAGAGLAAGLALLTKLSGLLTVAAAAATYALDAVRGPGRRRAAACAALALAVAGGVGGWYYLHSRIEYGYFQPYGLPAHRVMFRMPPGERSLGDYLRIPLATWTDPQLLNPDLLRSVWGSTYVSVWFDGHRSFLPLHSDDVRRLGTVTLLLALLPTAAFAVGLAGGARRALRERAGPDAPMVLLCLLVFAGFAVFTWRNPWFATVKGTSLLSLSLPFAWYTSGVLSRWTRGRAAAWIWAVLAALAVAVALGCTYDFAFVKGEVSGLDWEATP